MPSCFLTLFLGPRRTVCQWAEVRISPNCHHNEADSQVQSNALSEAARDEVEYHATEKDREIECREIVMQEELALHYEERNVVKCPSHEKETTHRIVFSHFR